MSKDIQGIIRTAFERSESIDTLIAQKERDAKDSAQEYSAIRQEIAELKHLISLLAATLIKRESKKL